MANTAPGMSNKKIIFEYPLSHQKSKDNNMQIVSTERHVVGMQIFFLVYQKKHIDGGHNAYTNINSKSTIKKLQDEIPGTLG